MDPIKKLLETGVFDEIVQPHLEELFKTAHLMGEYDALGYVLTSPRVNGNLRERITGKALEIKDELEKRDIEFKEAE